MTGTIDWTSYQHAKAAGLMVLVKSGRSLRSLIGCPNAYWTAKGLRGYRRRNPDWSQELNRIATENASREVSERMKRRNAERTHCKNGHAFAGDNVGFKKFSGTERIGRFCRICTRIAANKMQFMTAEKVDRVVLPAADLHDNRKIMTSYGRNDYDAIRRMMPSYLPDHVRDDIAQDVMLALLEGRITRDGVGESLRKVITIHNRMFPTKFARFGKAPLLSLDEVLFDSGSTTRADYVSEGLWA